MIRGYPIICDVCIPPIHIPVEISVYDRAVDNRHGEPLKDDWKTTVSIIED